MVNPKHISDDKALRVRRGRVDSVDLYEIKDSELDLLERGCPAGIQLNFAVFLLSLAFTSIASMATATFNSATAKTVFIVMAVVGILMGAYLLICWWRTRSSVTAVVRIIRSRIGEDVDAPLTDGPLSPAVMTTAQDEPVG